MTLSSGTASKFAGHADVSQAALDEYYAREQHSSHRSSASSGPCTPRRDGGPERASGLGSGQADPRRVTGFA